jgi:hypothetical protein
LRLVLVAMIAMMVRPDVSSNVVVWTKTLKSFPLTSTSGYSDISFGILYVNKTIHNKAISIFYKLNCFDLTSLESKFITDPVLLQLNWYLEHK